MQLFSQTELTHNILSLRFSVVPCGNLPRCCRGLAAVDLEPDLSGGDVVLSLSLPSKPQSLRSTHYRVKSCAAKRGLNDIETGEPVAEVACRRRFSQLQPFNSNEPSGEKRLRIRSAAARKRPCENSNTIHFFASFRTDKNTLAVANRTLQTELPY
ncbi:hypothetical protein RP20_CCG003417 [Aedes albopictus]|nr:hypothetical protein RP20_CCG003417 [Aedes albopictus]